MSVEIRRERLSETVIAGKRLGRHIEHDERSRDYAVTADTSGLVSIRHHRLVGVYDQGDVGSCTGNAGAGAMSTRPFGHYYHEPTALKFYSAAEKLDGGAGYPPEDEGSSGLSIAKVLKARSLISSYQHCFTPEAVYTALQTGPVMLGVSWLDGFDTPGIDGRLHYTGTSRGGHEICADQLDVEGQRIWITNSWSTSWSLSGRAYWTWADFAHVLADSGDATVPIK